MKKIITNLMSEENIRQMLEELQRQRQQMYMNHKNKSAMINNNQQGVTSQV
jgi:predicted nucleic acid-binding protein